MQIEAQEIRPQPGPQELFLSTPADIAIIGGSVYGGKTWCLVVEALRHVDNPGFNFVCFRREMPDIANPGGLWDESWKWYPSLGGVPRENTHEWSFPSGAWGKFAGLQLEKDKEGYKGAQICLLMFDQLETFTESQFWYLWTRNRSLCGVSPYTRASVNPDPDSFLAKLLSWWIDQDTGYSIPERSGVIRFFVRVDEEIRWSTVECPPDRYDEHEALKEAARADLEARYPGNGRWAQSLTYVLARLQDNRIGTDLDPEYEAKVRALPYVERERLLGGDKGGNWKVRATAGKVFNRAWFEIVDEVPNDCFWVRYWDKAGTQDAGCHSAGTRMGYSWSKRTFYITSCIAGQWSAANREAVIDQTAKIDGQNVVIWVEQEPGSGGKESAENTIGRLVGYACFADKVTGDKIRRAYPMSAQAEVGNVKLLRGDWNEALLDELHGFEEDAPRKDRVDSCTGAFNKLAEKIKNAFDISGGGEVEPVEVEKASENGRSQEVDKTILDAIRRGDGFGFR